MVGWSSMGTWKMTHVQPPLVFFLSGPKQLRPWCAHPVPRAWGEVLQRSGPKSFGAATLVAHVAGWWASMNPMDPALRCRNFKGNWDRIAWGSGESGTVWKPPRWSGKSAKTNLHALTFSIHFFILLAFLYISVLLCISLTCTFR